MIVLDEKTEAELRALRVVAETALSREEARALLQWLPTAATRFTHVASAVGKLEAIAGTMAPR